jgi:tyrosine-protein kinase Etk/Wzc
VLVGEAALEDVLQKTVVENLDVVACGFVPPNPSEILGSGKMKEFINVVKGSYDVVLFDSPPVLAVTDPSVLSTLADGVIVVVSAADTRVDALERTRELLDGVGARIFGIVLNNFNLKKAYGGYSGYYRYSYHGYGYGYGNGGNGGDGGKKKAKKRDRGRHARTGLT